MRVMVIIKATEDSEAGVLPTAGLIAAMGAYNQELLDAGIMQSGDGLKPTAQGVRVAFDGARRVVRPGPFDPVAEQVAGYWVWQVRDLDEAITWVMRAPNPMFGPSEVEIRPLYEMEDFAEVMPPDLAADAGRRRDALA